MRRGGRGHTRGSALSLMIAWCTRGAMMPHLIHARVHNGCRLLECRFDGFRFDGVTSMLYWDHGINRGFRWVGWAGGAPCACSPTKGCGQPHKQQ